MKVHRGTSLVELLVVMSAATVVLSLSSVLLHRAMRSQMHARAQADVERSALRLSHQFRRDVHQARSVAPDNANLGDNVFLKLSFADGRTAEYSFVGGTVRRVLPQDGSRPAREEFVFPSGARLDIREDESPRRLVLTITAALGASSSADGEQPLRATSSIPVSFQAAAAVGRALRFSGGDESQGEAQ